MRTTSFRGEGKRHRVGSLGLDPVDADPRTTGLESRRHARDQPPATDTDDGDVEVGQVLDEFEPGRPVPGDDRRIVEWVDQHEAFGVADPLQLGEGLADVGAVEHDPCPIAEAGLHLGADGAGRHHHRHRDPGRPPCPRVGLPGVAGRQGDRATGRSFGTERRDPVGHPTGLERPGLLEVLGLEIEAIIREADPGRGRRPRPGRGRRQHRRPVDDAGNPGARVLELAQRDVVRLRVGHAGEYRTHPTRNTRRLQGPAAPRGASPRGDRR